MRLVEVVEMPEIRGEFFAVEGLRLPLGLTWHSGQGQRAAAHKTNVYVYFG